MTTFRCFLMFCLFLILSVNKNVCATEEKDVASASDSVLSAHSIVFPTDNDVPLTYYKSSNFIAIRIQPNEPKEAISKLIDSMASNFTRDISFNKFQVLRYSKSNLTSSSNTSILACSSILSMTEKAKFFVNVYHSSSVDNTPFIPTGLIYLSFHESFDPEVLSDLLETYSLTVKGAAEDFGIIVSVTQEDVDPVDIAINLRQSPIIKYIEPGFTTPLTTCQWHHSNIGDHRNLGLAGLAVFKIGSDARIRAAWETIREWSNSHLFNVLSPVKVAVIDDAFNLKHPVLGDNLSPEWIQASRNFSNLIFLEDVNPTQHKITRHGTATSGLLLGRSDVGVAPFSIFIPVCYADEIEDTSLSSTFTYCNDQGADIISCSWGSKSKHYMLSTRLKRLITRITTTGRNGKGSIIIFAAGNNNVDIHDTAALTVNGFASHPDVIAVSASTSRDKKAHYSNYGDNISVCAPSGGVGGIEGLYTCDVKGYNLSGVITDDYRYDFDGTSAACPIVAGTVSLMLSINPQLTSREVKEIIQITARQIDIIDGRYSLKPITLINGGSYEKYHSPYYGYGCIDADEAVKEVIRRLSV